QLWDSKKINIYDFVVSKFKDSLAIVLYDSLMDVSCHPPIKGTKITSPFGFRGWRWHYGSDLKLNTGDGVYAVWDGIVRIRQYER
ncbi:M23 family metallopeptidase, partial [Penaeicola halotolerans]|uniref:M23 family metallopeptidase n=1 Tax=Penaeicola halotolerans TaxID=2793196 RepID=UPI0034DB0F1B